MQAANQRIGELLGAGASIPTAQLKALQQQASQLEKQGLDWLQSVGLL